jgi:hypothetical protein
VGLFGISGLWLFPIYTIWLEKTPLPAPELIGSVLPILPPLVAVVSGHLAMRRTGASGLRGRGAAWAGLAFGYMGLVAAVGSELIFWLIVVLHPRS